MPIYILELYGDIARGRESRVVYQHLNDVMFHVRHFIDSEAIDIEDDRILVWELSTDRFPYLTLPKLVWHFSGWHFDHEAKDVYKPGLKQLPLPGEKESIYERLSREV